MQINPAEVCEFFAIFARFEYAMKATRFCDRDRHDNAVSNWRSLKEALGGPIFETQSETINKALAYLLAEPPEVQKVINGSPQFRPAPLYGDTPGAKAIEAGKRVRNNLFHGGKHTPHSPPERDAKLIWAASAVPEACLVVDPELNSEFEHQLA